jgi:LPXTG-motif cell wall-anchored protein
VNKLKTALVGLSVLSMLALLFLAGGVSAQTSSRTDNVTSSALAQVATATPEAGMGMMEHPTATPDAGMMQNTPGDTMTSNNGTMTNSSLPATGSSDNSALLLLVAASALLLLGGFGISKTIAHRK